MGREESSELVFRGKRLVFIFLEGPPSVDGSGKA